MLRGLILKSLRAGLIALGSKHAFSCMHNALRLVGANERSFLCLLDRVIKCMSKKRAEMAFRGDSHSYVRGTATLGIYQLLAISRSALGVARWSDGACV